MLGEKNIKYPTVEYMMSEYMDFGFSYLKWEIPGKIGFGVVFFFIHIIDGSK